MNLAVLDTTACAAIMRHESSMLKCLQERSPGSFLLTPPTVAEIEYGVRRLEPGTRKRTLLETELMRLLNTFRVAEWSPAAQRSMRR